WQRRKPIIHVLAGLVLCVAIALLQSTFELVALPIDVSQIIVRQLGPLLFHLALDLFPIPFHLVPIHHTSSGFWNLATLQPTSLFLAAAPPQGSGKTRDVTAAGAA